MPAKRGDSQFEYPGYAEFHLRCNPGYDFIRFLGWLDEAPPEKFNHVFAAYARNPLGVIIASCAIEGYIHYVGHHLDPSWDEFTKEKNSVRDRIQRIYSLLKKPVDFGSGVMQQVVQLFQMRRLLVHPQYQETREERSSPPPNLFDHVDVDFPAAKSRQIAEGFRDALLSDAQMQNLWWRQSYAEKEKPQRFQREV
jgi:hypothetical protein